MIKDFSYSFLCFRVSSGKKSETKSASRTAEVAAAAPAGDGGGGVAAAEAAAAAAAAARAAARSPTRCAPSAGPASAHTHTHRKDKQKEKNTRFICILVQFVSKFGQKLVQFRLIKSAEEMPVSVKKLLELWYCIVIHFFSNYLNMHCEIVNLDIYH